MLTTESHIAVLIESDQAAMETLRTVATLGLPEWWVGAGFVRNRVWDAVSGNRQVWAVRDVDVAYFDPDRAEEALDYQLEAKAGNTMPGVPWEIRNQARMHLRNGDEAYTSTMDAIARWPETATCVGVTLDQDHVRLSCCHGVEDLVGLVVCPSPAFDHPAGRARIRQRVEATGWLERWPRLPRRPRG